MSPIYKPSYTGDNRTCVLCKKQFSIEEHFEHIHTFDLEITNYVCPDCIRKFPAIGNALSQIERKPIIKGLDFPDLKIPDFKREPTFSPNPTISKKIPQVEIPASINWVFWILIVVSISVFTYSLTSKLFPKLNLPDFPFYPYIIGYALLIILIQFKKFIPLFTIIALLNFGSPTFRGIFFSHFSSTIWTVVFTVMFIASNISSLLVLSSGLFLRFIPKKQQIDQMDIAKRGLVTLPLTLALYFGLISPFYLGAIKPGPYSGHIEPEPYKIDHIYQEVLTATIADRD